MLTAFLCDETTVKTVSMHLYLCPLNPAKCLPGPGNAMSSPADLSSQPSSVSVGLIDELSPHSGSSSVLSLSPTPVGNSLAPPAGPLSRSSSVLSVMNLSCLPPSTSISEPHFVCGNYSPADFSDMLTDTYHEIVH